MAELMLMVRQPVKSTADSLANASALDSCVGGRGRQHRRRTAGEQLQDANCNLQFPLDRHFIRK
jgi:hypothetical protein